MSKKHIIIISTMFIIGLIFFVTSWILSHRRINDVDTNENIVSNVPKTFDVPTRISAPRKKKEIVLTKETQIGDNTQEISNAVDDNQDEEQLEKFLDSLTEEKNEDALQDEENATVYAALRKPFEQLHSFYTQLDSHYSDERFDEVSKTFRIVDGRIVMDEIFEFLDKKCNT